MCKKANSFTQKRLPKFGAAFKNSIIEITIFISYNF